MSNKFKAVAVALVSLAAVFSCVENDRTLGEQLISEDYVLSVDSASFALPCRLRVHDTIQAVSYTHMMMGYFSDEVYGTTVVDGASPVVPIPDSCYLGINPKFIKATLSLIVDSTVVFTEGDEYMPQNIYLYEIVEDFMSDSTEIYNNSIKPEYLSEKPISLGSPMIFGKGTVKIGLTQEYGEKLLATSPAEFGDISLFMDRMYGIYIKTDKPDKGKEGGRMNFMNLSSSVISVEFLMNDPEKGIKDRDTTVTFVLGYAFALNQFSAGSRHLETETPKDTLYMDGLSGVKPVVPALEFKDLVDDWVRRVCIEKQCDKESILLSSAKMYFPYELPDDFQSFEKAHPLKIYPFTTNVGATDTTVRMTPLDGITSAAGGSMDRNKEHYYCDITSTVQKMILKDRGDIRKTDDMWLFPVNTIVNSSTYVTTYTIDVDNYKQVILNGPASARPPRIELVYGILKEW